MPREQKKRGRRENQKRKRREDDEELPPKRQKPIHEDSNLEETRVVDNPDCQPSDGAYVPTSAHSGGDREFYGFLDEQEQAYFKQADQLLDLNQFLNEEDRQLFITDVWKECSDKQLKLACSQSCSRVLERLIQLATTPQLKNLFQIFGDQ